MDERKHADPPVSEVVVFDEHEALARVFDDRELLADMLALLERESKRLMKLMDAALAEGDMEGVRKAAHSLKGAAFNCSAKKLAFHAHLMEHAAKEGRADKAAELRKKLPALLEELLKEAAPYLARGGMH